MVVQGLEARQGNELYRMHLASVLLGGGTPGTLGTMLRGVRLERGQLDWIRGTDSRNGC